MTGEVFGAVGEAPLGERSDAERVRRSISGDVGALEVLMRRHYRTAFAVAMAHSRVRADAEDACQAALAKAAERLASCRDPDRFAQWLCTIVRNHARNVLTRG